MNEKFLKWELHCGRGTFFALGPACIPRFNDCTIHSAWYTHTAAALLVLGEGNWTRIFKTFEGARWQNLRIAIHLLLWRSVAFLARGLARLKSQWFFDETSNFRLGWQCWTDVTCGLFQYLPNTCNHQRETWWITPNMYSNKLFSRSAHLPRVHFISLDSITAAASAILHVWNCAWIWHALESCLAKCHAMPGTWDLGSMWNCTAEVCYIPSLSYSH